MLKIMMIFIYDKFAEIQIYQIPGTKNKNREPSNEFFLIFIQSF